MSNLLKISKYKPSIFQGRFDFAGPNVSLTLEHPAESIILRILTIALITLVCGYLYFVSSSVLNVMARRQALSEVTKIQSAIGGLEQQYFTLSHNVGPQDGAPLGLAPVRSTQYVYRPGNLSSAKAVDVGVGTIGANAI